MKIITTFAFAVAMAAMATGAFAQDRIRAQDPSTLEAFLFDEGYPSKTGTDSYGDPAIQFRIGEQPFTITFWGCTNNTNCQWIRVASWFSISENVGADFVNELNNKNSFATAIIDPDRDLLFFRDELTGDTGMSRDDFRTIIKVFTDVVADAQEKTSQ